MAAKTCPGRTFRSAVLRLDGPGHRPGRDHRRALLPRAGLCERHAAARRPQICLGTDPDHTPAWLLAAARDANAGFEVVLDGAFAGCHVPLRRYRHDDPVASIMVEMRRDILADPKVAARAAEALTGLAAAAVRQP